MDNHQSSEGSFRPQLSRNRVAIFYIAFSVLLLVCAWLDGRRREAPPNVPPAVLATRIAEPVPAHTAAPAHSTAKKHGADKKTHAAGDIYRRLGRYVAGRYQISSEVATDIVAKAHAVGRKLELDPLLILAVISVESRFNPGAESARGAKGLMQVIPRWHADKLESVGGEEKVFELEPNIMVGSRILKEYLRPTGELVDALQRYVGASSEEDANAYLVKVTRERDILWSVSHRSGATGTAL